MNQADRFGGPRAEIEAPRMAGQTLPGVIRQAGGWGNKITEALGTAQLKPVFYSMNLYLC